MRVVTIKSVSGQVGQTQVSIGIFVIEWAYELHMIELGAKAALDKAKGLLYTTLSFGPFKAALGVRLYRPQG